MEPKPAIPTEEEPKAVEGRDYTFGDKGEIIFTPTTITPPKEEPPAESKSGATGLRELALKRRKAAV